MTEIIRGSTNGSHTLNEKLYSDSARFFVLAFFLTVVFLTGGGSRADIQSLVLLRPLAALTLGYGLLTVTWEQCRRHIFALTMLCVLLSLAVAQLIPLPASLWHALPGREIVAAIDSSLGLSGAARPVSLSPSGTVNAALSLLVPLAALILAIQLTPRHQAKLLFVLICLGFLSAMFGVLQMIGDPNGPLYTFRITNPGSPVGLFANRNHQAILLSMLIPLLALWTLTAQGNWNRLETPRGRRAIVGIFVTLILVPLVLMIGSRAGIGAIALSLFGSAALVMFRTGKVASRSRYSWPIRLSFVIVFAAVLALLAYLIIWQGRGLALDRLIMTDPAEEGRLTFVALTYDIAKTTFPFGTGLGSFVPVYQIYETDASLSPYYVNHAHSDFAEMAMTGGLVGLLLLFAGLLWLVRASVRLLLRWKKQGFLDARVAAPLLALWLIVFGSIGDYPIRTPILSAVATILVVWTSRGLARSAAATEATQ